MDAATAPVIVAARRTPIGTAGHALRDTTVDQLGAAVISAVCDDLAALGSTSPVEQVVMGNCLGPGGNVARVSALGAGLPADVPAMTVDLQCGSGLAAVTTALAAAGISVNPVSAFHHDHLFVPADRAGEAMDVLVDLSSRR